MTIQQFIREAFERNYEQLKLENAHGLAPNTKRQALQQVLLYYQRLKDIAESVTDTEVKLTLPEQKTPNGNKFAIEGVVDMVREEGKTTMYDIKTHDADAVRANIGFYEKQLNVYAYIWQQLRKESLDATAIISTQIPKTVNDAYGKEMELFLEQLEEWNPVVPIKFSQENVMQTIAEFALMVDKIEAGDFAPPPLEKLISKLQGKRFVFATHICRNCDARFSCSSYRRYAVRIQGGGNVFKTFFSDLGDSASVALHNTGKLVDEKPLLNAKEELENLF